MLLGAHKNQVCLPVALKPIFFFISARVHFFSRKMILSSYEKAEFHVFGVRKALHKV